MFVGAPGAQDSGEERVAYTIFCVMMAEEGASAPGKKERTGMNPLTSLTGTVIAGLALLVVMVFIINVIGS